MHLKPWRTPKSIALVALLVADAAVFGSTDAAKVASFMLIMGFVLLMLTIYAVLYGLLSVTRFYGLEIRRKGRLAGSLTGLAAAVVALQSVGELNFRDVLLLLPLVLIGYAYSFYGAGASSPEA